MIRNTIRLTESQLHRVIRESVKQIINEMENGNVNGGSNNIQNILGYLQNAAKSEYPMFYHGNQIAKQVRQQIGAITKAINTVIQGQTVNNNNQVNGQGQTVNNNNEQKQLQTNSRLARPTINEWNWNTVSNFFKGNNSSANNQVQTPNANNQNGQQTQTNQEQFRPERVGKTYSNRMRCWVGWRPCLENLEGALKMLQQCLNQYPQLNNAYQTLQQVTQTVKKELDNEIEIARKDFERKKADETL